MFIEPRNVVLRDLLTLIDEYTNVVLTIEYDDGECLELDKVFWREVKLTDDLVQLIEPIDHRTLHIVVYHEYIY